MAVTTTLANCQSACNLGEMLCLNKNASSTLCSAVQGACMAGCYASHVDCGCADASVTHCEEIKLRPTRMTPTDARENFFHTGHSLRERVRPQAPISRSSRLAGRESVCATGGRPGQALPALGVAAHSHSHEPAGGRSPPRPRVAAASRGLCARAAGEPARISPGNGNARSRFVYLGCLPCVNGKERLAQLRAKLETTQ